MELPTNVSEAFRKRNPDHYPMGSVETKVNKPDARGALVKDASSREAGESGVAYRVVLSVHTKKLMDSHDNLRHGCKPLCDAIAASLGLDDGDTKRVAWEYGQVKTDGPEGVCVTIHRL